MPNRPPAKLTPADLRKLKKVATGPLLGGVPGAPKPAPGGAASAKAATLGNFAGVKARLEALRTAAE